MSYVAKSRPFRVTIVHPCVGRHLEMKRYIRTWKMEPIPAAMLAALIPPDVEKRFYDDRLEPIPYDEPTDLVAISVETYTARRAYQIASEYRSRGVPVVMGGFHATLCPEEVMQYCESIVLGEAETLLPEVIDDYRHGRPQQLYQSSSRPELVVTPDRSIFQGKKYLPIRLVEFARGCRFKCDFCAVQSYFGATHNHRPVDRVIAEIHQVRRRGQMFFFIDDNITSNLNEAKELMRALIPLKVRWVSQSAINVAYDEEALHLMKRSGCQGVLVGFESLDSKSLRQMNKGFNLMQGGPSQALANFRRHGLRIYGTFIFGYDHDTAETFDNTVEFAKQQGMFIAAFNHITPFPGTPLYRRMKDEGRLLYDAWWLDDRYRYNMIPFQPKQMSPQQLADRCVVARRSFYSWSSIFRRAAKRVNFYSPFMLLNFLVINAMHHWDIEGRNGLPLGDENWRGALIKARESFQIDKNGSFKMGRYQFELATDADDAELRQILAETPMPGKISLTFQRNPSYFDAAVVDGTFRQVVVCREDETQQILGFGSRSVREMYVNGKPTPIGYLSMLRALQQYRNMGLLARGYKFFRDLHSDRRAELYLTTIAEGNDKTISILTSGRAGLPKYHLAGKYYTVAIPIIKRPRQHSTAPSVNVRPATNADLDVLLEFLERVGPSRQFFPQYRASDFFHADGTFKDFSPSDLLLAFQQGKLVGTLGGWDQHRFRQTVVEKYDSLLQWARPVYNCWASLRGRPKLPSPGEAFRYLLGALPVVENNDRDIFSALLETQLARACNSQCDYLLLGLHETDTLLPLVIKRGAASYVTRLYHACWEDGEALRGRLDGRPFYLELGCL